MCAQQQVTLKMVQEAQERLAGVAQKTGLSYTNSVSHLSNSQVWLKLENLQRTGSFKLRGAYNKVAALSDEERQRLLPSGNQIMFYNRLGWARTHLKKALLISSLGI